MDEKTMLFKQGVFADWISEHVLQSMELDTLSTVMVWPFNSQEPQYRDNYPRKATNSMSTLRDTD